jgi:hypothetical protein
MPIEKPLSFSKQELDTILEVNKKAIEIETEVAGQNEVIIELLTNSKYKQDSIENKIDKVIKQGEDISKDMFKMTVFYITGILALVAQIIQLFFKK